MVGYLSLMLVLLAGPVGAGEYSPSHTWMPKLILGNTLTCSGSNINMDAGTLYLDCTNNRLGIGHTSPAQTVDGTISYALSASQFSTIFLSSPTFSSVATGAVGSGMFCRGQSDATDNNIGGAAHLVCIEGRMMERTINGRTNLYGTIGRVDGISTNTGTGFLNVGLGGAVFAAVPAGVASDQAYRGVVSEVRVTASGDGAGAHRSTGAVANFYADTHIGGDPADSYGIYLSTGPKNYLEADLGLGTTSPIAKLHVAGTTLGTGVSTWNSSMTVNGRFNAISTVQAIDVSPLGLVKAGGHYAEATIKGASPDATGYFVTCTDCALTYDTCVSTGTGVNQWRLLGRTGGCD